MAKTSKEFLAGLVELADGLRRQIDASMDGWDVSPEAIAERRLKVFNPVSGFEFWDRTYFRHYGTAEPSAMHNYLYKRLPEMVNGSLSLWRAPDITAAVWTSATPVAAGIYSLTFASGYFYISVGSYYYRSLNGVTWSLVASAPAGMSFTYCVQAVAGLLLAVGGGSSTAMGYSADGLASFRMLAVPFNGSNRVHLVNDMIVLTGTPGGIYTNY